jgi:predicted AlkP superfamily pyrophosphatase or phosphodiesterase
MRSLALLSLVSTMLLAVAASPAPPVSLLLVSIDGLRPDYVLEADRHGVSVPHLRRLVTEGAFASGVAGVLPTVTFPSHTTIVTGVSPNLHGIVANTPFDPLARNLDGWYWYAEDIKVETLWDAAAKAGMITSSVEWPATAGARITWNLPQYWRGKNPEDRKLYRLLATPGLLPEAEAAIGPYPPSYEWTVAFDRRRAAFNVYLLERKRPRLHLCYFSGLDEEAHESGPGSARTLAVLEEIDRLFGEVRAAAERNGPVVVAVVSDHGFRTTDREVHLNEWLREEGLLALDGRGRVTGWRAAAWSAGGSAAIMLRDPSDEEARRVTRLLLDRLAADASSGVKRILEGAEIRALGGFPDAAFLVGLAPNARMGAGLEAPAWRVGPVRGTHGMLPDDTEMDSAFFLAGAGVPRGRNLGRIDMRDIAPTLARRLGLRLPAAEGRDLLP